MPRTHTSSRTMGAIQIIPGQSGEQSLGVFSQLPADAPFIISDEHATENTVKIRYKDRYYLVFRRDIERQKVTLP